MAERINPDKPMRIVPVELGYSDIEALTAYARMLGNAIDAGNHQ